MNTQPRNIEVKGSIERNGVAYGCVRKDLKSQKWSYLPKGSYTPEFFEKACDLFDTRRADLLEEYEIPEGAANAGETSTRLVKSSDGIKLLANVTKEIVVERYKN